MKKIIKSDLEATLTMLDELTEKEAAQINGGDEFSHRHQNIAFFTTVQLPPPEVGVRYYF